MRGGLNALRFFFLVLLVTLGALILFISTDAGKAKVIELALSHVNKQAYKIKIEDIESYYPLKIKFAHIKILENGHPQVFLRGVTLMTDGPAFFLDKVLQGAVDIEECLLFDSPVVEDGDFKPLSLPIGLDLKVNCKSVLVEENGANYFIRASVSDAAIQYNPVDDVLSYDGKVLLNLSGQFMPITLSGKGPLNDFYLRYQLDGSNYAFGPVNVFGVHGGGTIEHLPWKGSGDLDLTFAHERAPGTLKARFVQDRFVFKLEDLDFKAKGFSLAGQIEYNARFTELKGEVKAHLDNHPSLREIPDLPLAGLLHVHSLFDYHGGDLNLKLEASGKDLKTGEHSIQSFEIDLDGHSLIREPAGKLNVRASHIGGFMGQMEQLTCEGSFDKGVGDVVVKVKGDQLTLDTAVSVNYQKAERLLKFNSFIAKYEDIDVNLTNPCEISLSDHSMSLTPANLKIMTSPLRVEGEFVNGNLNLKAVGELDLVTLSQLYMADDDVLTGKMHLDMKVMGPLNKIRLEGNAEINGGLYENVIYGTAIKDIRLKLRADNEALTIVNCTARDANVGNLTASGRLVFADQGLDLQFRVENFMLLHTDRMSMVARDADVTLKGHMVQPTLGGMILVDQASYSIAPQVKSERRVLNIKNPVKRKKPDITAVPIHKPAASLFNPVLNLVLKFPPVLKIQGRGLSSVWKGKLEFTQTYDHPLVSGKLNVDAGNMNFLGQMVKMQKGTIKFDGSVDNVPYIDTTGVLEKPDLNVTVGIVGRVNKPNIDLQSQPALPKDEILSYLFFGKDKSTLSPIEGVQLARALAAYKGVGPDTEFLSIITDNLGLDQFTIGSGATEGTYTVKVSKRLGDKIRVSLDQGMKPEDSKVELEVDVTKNISVKAEHGFAGSADGASVNYNWDY